MKVEENAFVALNYTLTNPEGEVLDQSTPDEPLGFVYGEKMIIPGLESQLLGMTAGENKKVVVEPGDGYGELEPDLFREIPKTAFPEDQEVVEGMSFAMSTPHGVVTLLVAEVGEELVTVNLNHPLAGVQLHFDVTIAEVREATPADRAQLHGCDADPGGCGGCCC